MTKISTGPLQCSTLISTRGGTGPHTTPSSQMWKEACNSGDQLSPLSIAETRFTFAQLSLPQCKDWTFRFFLDGLDEFQGNPGDCAELIKSFSTLSDLDVMMSSRAIPSCVQAFSSSPGLYLQDLTRGDIAAYIEHTLIALPYTKNLRQKEPERMLRLTTGLVDKAPGVFQWVALVCRALLDGLDNYDRLAELKQIVDELPEELEEVYEFMLLKISHTYR
jgi:hypothetical protein